MIMVNMDISLYDLRLTLIAMYKTINCEIQENQNEYIEAYEKLKAVYLEYDYGIYWEEVINNE